MSYGVYLDALAIFFKITGVAPVTLDAETNAHNLHFHSSAAHALGISATNARLPAIAARETIRAGMPVCFPTEYPSWPCAVLLHPHPPESHQKP